MDQNLESLPRDRWFRLESLADYGTNKRNGTGFDVEQRTATDFMAALG
ncbi:MAG: hypothetical protein AAFW95_06560 [Cyanobacteria bacterium J06638_6]